MKDENKKKTTTRATTKKTTTRKETSQTAKKSSNVKKVASKKGNTAKKVSSVKKVDSIKPEEKELETIVVESSKKEVPISNDQNYTRPQENVLFVLRAFTLLAATVLVIVAGIKIFKEVCGENYSSRWENKSYLVEQQLAQVLTCSQIESAMHEGDNFLFLTTYSEGEFKLEKDLASLIKDYRLEKSFYVFPFDEDCAALSELKLQVEKVPSIYYFRNGVFQKDVIREDKKMIEAADFQKLLDIYEFRK